MPNNYFQFKQFTVQQEMCAMKVCTDACLFGAWVAQKIKSENEKIKSVLDIGTGSGCIPVSLKKKLPQAEVYACDVSEGALAVATRNAATHQTPVHFLQVDFLQANTWSTLPEVDIIVSNPPYIPYSDKSSMLQNVLAYEPHLALFVPNDDALVFYEAIARFAQQKLSNHGCIFVEIHEDLGKKTKELFEAKGFSAEIKKDFQGKDRMVKANVIM